ncbi:MAG TPA: HEAT repeat domain-containing protein, partial [Vicinamibacteria bacterium]|nr:HEAT repeat domain-containing protein [Vicinamibacteria bacterium]
RAEAAQKVGESGNALYAPRLLALLADDDERVRQSAVAALATFKDPAVDERLLAATADRDFRIRQGALAALGQAGRLGTPARLLPLLKDPVASVRAEAVRALGRLGLPEHRQVLDAAADPDAGVRLALAETLAPLSSATAREALVALTRDRAVQVRQVAVGALSMKK